MPRPAHHPRSATNVDQHVGQRMRLRRTLLGMSQTQLGDLIGLTFQQVQKYERGFNRVGASRLFELARVLGVPLPYFFDGLDQTQKPVPVEGPTDFAAAADPLTKRETLELVRAYYRIENLETRHKLVELIRHIAGVAEIEAKAA